MQTNPAIEQNKNIKSSESPSNQFGRKGKGLWRRGFADGRWLVQKSSGRNWTADDRFYRVVVMYMYMHRVCSASRLKTAGELKIALAGTASQVSSARAMHEHVRFQH